MKRTGIIMLAICVLFPAAYSGCGSGQGGAAYRTTIVSCTPSDGDTRVPVMADIDVVFSGALDESSVNWRNVRLIHDSENGKRGVEPYVI